MNEGLEFRTLQPDDSIGMSDAELCAAKKQVDAYDRWAERTGRYKRVTFRQVTGAHVAECFGKARKNFRDKVAAKREERKV